MVFLLVCLIIWGVIIKKPIPAGFLTLATAFGFYFVGNMFDIHEYLPSGLLIGAQMLVTDPSPSLIQILCITGGIILISITVTLLNLRSMEWNTR